MSSILNELARQDYWRCIMYASLQEQLEHERWIGTGVEFGGSNKVIQNYFPRISWEIRKYPKYDITKEGSFEKKWDVIVADQILEHVTEPWTAMRLIGESTKIMAVITVPFMIRIHRSPEDYWRMTPKAIKMLAEPYFKNIDIRSWGTTNATLWHSLYDNTPNLLANVAEEELATELNSNDGQRPFVIWAVLRK